MVCSKCGAEVSGNFCGQCGEQLVEEVVGQVVEDRNQLNTKEEGEKMSDKSGVTTLILAILLGSLGIHRFYVGKIGTGVLWMFTLGFWGIGTIVDIINIACGKFKDSYGLTVSMQK